MDEKNVIDQMVKISKSVLKAKDSIGKTVEYCREDVIDEGANILRKDSSKKLITFGVKNTNQISRDTVDRLVDNGYLFHTVDKMALGGRAIDVDIINPLTGNVMTGSTSGGCANILLGINDFALGTDGGGSVLAPAISTGLYSIMGKGLGLRGSKRKVSTDKISFLSGLGVISHDYSLCIDVIKNIVNLPGVEENFKIAIPRNRIENKSIRKVVRHLECSMQFKGVEIEDKGDREYLIDRCNEIFNDDMDLVITEEGPIDLFGLGDSVLGTWGNTGKDIQNSSGKELLKVANMINATAVTIPTGELGKGILIIGKEGLNYGSMAISIGKIIMPLFSVPELFRRYFINGYNRDKGGFI
ncbi:hypothetical protein K8M07_11675 [Schnuerera sp. xch1]|uniref:amidase family protein n=1 Tax=Schnuerera sp. xch1 TaxID=2874283 RepID=UPI001CBD2A68|nr:amidase family protein [Schnuerera sp. xch1]MBZ2175896.1 hypothetical protein [Schnuerera sp. xch1]